MKLRSGTKVPFLNKNLPKRKYLPVLMKPRFQKKLKINLQPVLLIYLFVKIIPANQNSQSSLKHLQATLVNFHLMKYREQMEFQSSTRRQQLFDLSQLAAVSLLKMMISKKSAVSRKYSQPTLKRFSTSILKYFQGQAMKRLSS